MESVMDSLIGKTLGNFEILKLIGRGGMSSVYLASDKDLERHVALKIPHERFLDDASFVKRFKREAKAMARLRHPNIVQIYSVGSHGEMPFFAMEHIRGNSLEKVVKKRGLLRVGVALEYISQIARAIEYAHKKGVIHRDIKPANILVDSSGRLLVTDFGVSKLLSDEATHDTAGFVGTPQYMSPEQCGQGTLDHRTDIYSMGAVLFEMVTGQAAFSSSSPAEVIKKQLFDMPEFPADLQGKIPEKIQAIISKMLAKDPEQRYPDISSFLSEIETLDRERDKPAKASPTAETIFLEDPAEPTARAAKRKQRRKRRLALAFACLLVVFAAAFLFAFKLNDPADLNLASLMDTLRKNERLAAFFPVQEPPQDEPAASPPQEAENPTAISLESEVQAAPEPEWAKIVLNSVPPGARVVLDSEPRGVTPLTLSEVTPGKHTLAMRLDGYPEYNEEASADAAAPLEILHDFEAAKEALIPKGSLTIDSEPSGALVFINGERKGKTRLELPNLRSADYTIALEMEGYEPVRRQITLLADENLRISLDMVEQPKYGSLSVDSRPKGADVLLNGEYKGATPLVLTKILAGEYDVTLRKDGYRPFRRGFTCEKDSEGTIEATLEITPKFAARQSMIEGDKHIKKGELVRAAAAYERALSLDPKSPVYRQKFRQVRRSLTMKEIKDLLSSYKLAYDSENAKLLASVLDNGNPEFLSDQVTNAESLFREFDNIHMVLSEPKLSHKGPGEVSVEFRLSIYADFAETGTSTELLNTDQTLKLRRNPKDGWRICEIE